MSRNTRVFRECDNCGIDFEVGTVAHKSNNKYCPRCRKVYNKAITDFKDYIKYEWALNRINSLSDIENIAEHFKAGEKHD